MKGFKDHLIESGKFILALKDGDKVIGFYVSDDKKPVNDKAKAHKYATQAAADSEAKICNKQWDLEDGQKFVVMNESLTEGVSKGSPTTFEIGTKFTGAKDYQIEITNIYVNATISGTSATTWVEYKYVSPDGKNKGTEKNSWQAFYRDILKD